MIDQRRSKRFKLQLPIEIVRAGSESPSGVAETRNLSSGGVLILSPIPLRVGDPVEYRISLPGEGERVFLHCKGKVLRRQNGDGQTSEVAVSLERYEFVRASPVAASE